MFSQEFEELIKEKGPGFFRAWLDRAKQDYPHIPESSDAQEAVNDLLEAFSDALVSIHQAPAQKQAQEGWKEGYVAGFVEGNINTHWLIRFVIRDTDQYRRLILLKSLNTLIYVDSDVQYKLRHLYKHLLKEEHNPLVERESNIISLEDYGITNSRELEDIVEEIRRTISGVIEKDYLDLLNGYQKSYCPDLVEFLGPGVIEKAFL